MSLASSLLAFAFGVGLGDFLGGGDTLVGGDVGTVRLRVPGEKSAEVEVAKVNADACLAPDCDRSLSLGMRESVVLTEWGGGGGGGGGYPRKGGRKLGGGAGGGTVGKAPPATSGTPAAGLCGCWWRL